MKNKRNTLFNPLTFSGLLFVLAALGLLFITFYFFYLSAALLATGIFAIWLSWPIRVYARGKMYYLLQYGLTSLIIGGWGLSYLHWDASTSFILQENHPDSILIVYGIEESPPLPSAFLWKRKVNVPENGIIVTSSKEAEKRIKLVDHNGNSISHNAYDWNANSWYPCILTESTIHYWVLSFGNIADYPVDTLKQLANRINSGNIRSSYSQKSPINRYDDKIELYLQGQGLTSLPDNLFQIPITVAYLTGNRFTEIPPQIIELENLEMLYISHNEITHIGHEISKLKNLKYLSLNGNPINPADTNTIKALLPNCEINFN